MNILHITHIQDGVYIGRVRAHQEQVRLQRAGIRLIRKLSKRRGGHLLSAAAYQALTFNLLYKRSPRICNWLRFVC
ncbi:MAG: hypothetical protein HS099_27135 [Ardenticatenaceae bacterium]|nr:hypothetical protein [Ardenticatenaceae bacterium]